jgi:hypothetical protein
MCSALKGDGSTYIGPVTVQMVVTVEITPPHKQIQQDKSAFHACNLLLGRTFSM